jgi:SET domain-containing protein
VADEREKEYERSGMGGCYLFRLDKDAIVDATNKGNVARFINHCCEPNSYSKIVTVEDGSKHIIIFAKQRLRAGQEVVYDYQFPFEEEKLACNCGAPKCSGRMN